MLWLRPPKEKTKRPVREASGLGGSNRMAEGGFSHLSYRLHPTLVAFDKLDGQPPPTLRLPDILEESAG